MPILKYRPKALAALITHTRPATWILYSSSWTFVFPGANRNVAQTSEALPPWTWEGAEKFPSPQQLLLAISKAEEDVNETAVPFNVLRSLHPKATVYTGHKTPLLAVMANNRDLVMTGNGGGSKFSGIGLFRGAGSFDN
ncbi:hypothetical protein DL765_008381 [Monosporascus sp. GIB2]|nr:hypothetical protein DL765_008381 [Monosporascus sp. GIB2]